MLWHLWQAAHVDSISVLPDSQVTVGGHKWVGCSSEWIDVASGVPRYCPQFRLFRAFPHVAFTAQSIYKCTHVH